LVVRGRSSTSVCSAASGCPFKSASRRKPSDTKPLGL